MKRIVVLMGAPLVRDRHPRETEVQPAGVSVAGPVNACFAHTLDAGKCKRTKSAD